MDKAAKNKVLFTKFIIVFYILSLGCLFFIRYSMNLNIDYSPVFSIIVFLIIINFIKLYKLYKQRDFNKLYMFFNLVEVLCLLIISQMDFYNIWAYFGVFVLITFYSQTIDFKRSHYFVLGTIIVNLILTIASYFLSKNNLSHNISLAYLLYLDLLFGLSILIISVFSGIIQKDNLNTEIQNKRLVKEIEEKYDMLAIAQKEIKNHYDKLKYTNKKLEESNLKLSNSIGEFYTLHQISTAISSILNIKELLRYVNDIMIGVMGVQYSTIAIFDDQNSCLKVHTTNIKDNDVLFSLFSNINSNDIADTLNSGKPLINNLVRPGQYPFTSRREVNSLICAPLISKTKKLGVVIIEHKLHNAFGEDKIRLMEIICQQVSIAMENAELYQKMHELAITDWLTGVYNRVYFEEVLSKELNSSRENNFQLCVSILDIDLFKRINDTFGHVFGDQVIKEISETVRESLGYTDIIARYGGEEFIILMPETSFEQAYAKLDALRIKIENTVIRDDDDSVSVTASFGVSCYPLNSTSEKELLKHADAALYQAKDAGRNCVKMYNK